MADPLDWNAIDEVGGDGRLLEYLIAHVPRARWGEPRVTTTAMA